MAVSSFLSWACSQVMTCASPCMGNSFVVRGGPRRSPAAIGLDCLGFLRQIKQTPVIAHWLLMRRVLVCGPAADAAAALLHCLVIFRPKIASRSEEHTSELQSPCNL